MSTPGKYVISTNLRRSDFPDALPRQDEEPSGVVAFIPWEVIYRLGLAVLQLPDLETRRAQFGSETVDFVSETTRIMIESGKVPR